MKSTADHHALGVKMGKLCLQKATLPPPASDARLRQLCSGIVEAQSREKEQLERWLAQWYGIRYEAQVRQPGQLERLKRLSGEKFDVEISKMFIQHHRMQIRESEECLERAFHKKLRSFCKHTIEEQSQEIKEFRTILAQHDWKDERPKGHHQEA